jgi:hypothetical protein
MDIEGPVIEGANETQEGGPQQEASSKSGRAPTIVLTAATNLMQLQRQFKGFVSGNFEFRSTRSGTRIVTKEIGDLSAIKTFLEKKELSFYTFFPKSEKPIKAVLRHYPLNTPAEDISDRLVGLGFDVISVRQMTTTRRTSPEGSSTPNLPLFLITLPRTAKSHDIFRLTNLCHIAIRVEVYKAQNGLTQCYNCQQFGHVWASCKQPPRCLWCGGGPLHKECPQKEKADSTPACCNCKLTEGEKAHPANYRGCSHAKEEMQKTKVQRTQKPPTGMVFSATRTTTGVSFAAALRGKSEDQQQPAARQVMAASGAPQTRTSAPPPLPKQQPTGQSAQACNVNSLPLDNMLRAITVVQQIMAEFSGAVPKQDKILAITKIVLDLMEQTGH